MTVTANGRRFSPRAGDPIPVTDREAPTSTGAFEGVASERETGPEPSTLHPDTVTRSDLVRGWLVAAKGYLTPPQLLTDPPPAYTDLVDYAYRGGWTRHPYHQAGAAVTNPVTGKDEPVTTRLVRRAGIWWHRLASLPVTFCCRYAEWIWQRPGRALAVVAVWKLLMLTGPGAWAATYLIRPTLAAAAWVLL